LQALFQEIDFIADCYRGKKLTAIYIGGGTPTTLTEGQLDSLLAKIGASLDLSQLREYTVEAGRPDSITRAKLAVLQKHYVNRISINPQSMNDKTLELIGRKHTAKEVREAFQLAREMGFANINMDIILGLPGETPADLAATMAELAKLNPDSLTVHALAVKRGAKLTDWVNENGLADIVVTEETVQIAADGARDMGMQPYYVYRQKNTAGNFENVGYAKEGHYGLYNVLMMEEVHDVAAIGAGAITKRVFADGQAKRCDSVKELEQYIERIAEMIGRKRELLQVSNT
jgi:oxygen-independent coproporphyrinogen-3 oxidase